MNISLSSLEELADVSELVRFLAVKIMTVCKYEFLQESCQVSSSKLASIENIIINLFVRNPVRLAFSMFHINCFFFLDKASL